MVRRRRKCFSVYENMKDIETPGPEFLLILKNQGDETPIVKLCLLLPKQSWLYKGPMADFRPISKPKVEACYFN